jgi:hypothetical protein
MYESHTTSAYLCPGRRESETARMAPQASVRRRGRSTSVQIHKMVLWNVWDVTTPASIAVGLAFLRCGIASPPAPTRSRKTRVAHRRIKIEQVYRPYLTAWETQSLLLTQARGSACEAVSKDLTQVLGALPTQCVMFSSSNSTLDIKQPANWGA